MKIDTKEKYKARYHRRGEKAIRRLDKDALDNWLREHSFDSHEIGHGSKPNHSERTVDIKDCFAPLRAGHEHL